MRTLFVILLLALAVPIGAAAQVQGQGQGADRRARLEQQVRNRFLQVATTRLQLDTAQRQRLANVLDEGAEARRQLAIESRRLRQRLVAAAQEEATPSSTFETILRDMEALREREHALQRREQERLSAFLTPRQRAMFLIMRMRFTEQVRELRGRPGRGIPR